MKLFFFKGVILVGEFSGDFIYIIYIYICKNILISNLFEQFFLKKNMGCDIFCLTSWKNWED